MEDIKEIAEKAAKDSKAFDKLYEVTCKGVWFTCISLLKNEQTAKDIMQETYLIAVEKLGSLEDFSKVQNWLNKIAANKCKNYFASKQSKESYCSGSEADEVLSEELIISDDYITAKEKRQVIMDIIRNSLSDEQYQTVTLYYFDEMTVSEIAELMECHEKTVMYRLNTARQKIKEGVEQYEKENDDKLHAIMPIPFLTKLLQTESQEINVPDINFHASTNKAETSFTAKSKNGGILKMLRTVQGKILAGVIALLLAVGGTVAVGCGKDKENNAKDGKSSSVTENKSSKSKSKKNNGYTYTEFWAAKHKFTKNGELKQPEYIDFVDGKR